MITRQSRRPPSAPQPKARYRGGRAFSGDGDLISFGPADAIALRAKSRETQ